MKKFIILAAVLTSCVTTPKSGVEDVKAGECITPRLMDFGQVPSTPSKVYEILSVGKDGILTNVYRIREDGRYGLTTEEWPMLWNEITDFIRIPCIKEGE